jgi:hypothetical protein
VQEETPSSHTKLTFLSLGDVPNVFQKKDTHDYLVWFKNSKKNIFMNRGGSIFNETRQYLAYADDIVLLTRNMDALKAVLCHLQKEVKNQLDWTLIAINPNS